MKKTMFYHILNSKAIEEEHKRFGYVPRLHNWEVVESRDVTPYLYLFPWEITKVLTDSDLGHITGLELTAEKVHNHILKHWDDNVLSRVLRMERIPILIRDMDTDTEHNLFFKKWPSDENYSIQGGWFKEFVVRRSLMEGTLIGMYWDIKSSNLRFSVLEGPKN